LVVLAIRTNCPLEWVGIVSWCTVEFTLGTNMCSCLVYLLLEISLEPSVSAHNSACIFLVLKILTISIMRWYGFRPCNYKMSGYCPEEFTGPSSPARSDQRRPKQIEHVHVLRLKIEVNFLLEGKLKLSCLTVCAPIEIEVHIHV
jgi:hypothetical protein